MKKSIWISSVFLYGLFLSYRIYFWNGLPSGVLNALSDTAISFVSAYILYFVLEKRIRKRRLLLVLSSVILVYVSFHALRFLHYKIYLYSGVLDESFMRTFESDGFQIFDVLTVIIIGMFGNYSYFKYLEAEHIKVKAENLKLENVMTELKFLKGQIHPHFIFNSLNLIYFSIDKSNSNARNLLTSFSDLLRYQIYNSQKSRISFTAELEFINRYINVYLARMKEHFDFKRDILEPERDFEIPPLILLPFIENAFKHAQPALGDKSVIEMSIKSDDSALYFSLSNSKNGENRRDSGEKGIGVSNVRRRLDLIYDNRYQLDIDESEREYNVNLKLPIT